MKRGYVLGFDEVHHEKYYHQCCFLATTDTLKKTFKLICNHASSRGISGKQVEQAQHAALFFEGLSSHIGFFDPWLFRTWPSHPDRIDHCWMVLAEVSRGGEL